MNKKSVALTLMAVFVCASFAGCGGGLEPSSDESSFDPPTSSSVSHGASSEDPAPPDEPKEVTYDTYGSFWMRQHDYKTMPVGAYNSLPPKLSDFTYNYLESEQTYIDYAEAGVNTMMGLYEYAASEAARQALDWCSDYGLAYLMPLSGADSFISDSVPKSTLSKVRYHDAFAGIMQADEPGRVAFEKLARSAEIIDGVIPEDTQGVLQHVNLFPTYASKKQLYFRIPVADSQLPEGGYDYERYVSDYIQICKPKLLSYDFYPCRGDYGSLMSGYYDNMAVIRRYAARENIPFWVFIQTCSFGGNTRVPDKADLLWQVNTALAYGAKGIQYFTGVVPTNGDGTGERFSGAMFDCDGNKTEVYEYVKEAGAQISAADEVLMCCKSKGLIFEGSEPWKGAKNEIPESDLLSSYGALKTVSAKHAVVGCFDYDGGDAFYVANNSVKEGDEVTLRFEGQVSGYTIKGGVKTAFSAAELTLEAGAGEGILVVLNK